ncbi:sensor histidine kinase [Polyangium aurulentum]|uniref:sensor histidine kinase n=1 Tax=Polyangium aurulentum TaxID=2567896 RepID=UPI00146BF164|nr:ATP-binding protein [Polyangium aurulentum]UQA56654.1 PAS domain-containing protein [Polyangium aurulentum]
MGELNKKRAGKVSALLARLSRVFPQRALRRRERSLSRAQRTAHIGSWEWDVRTGRVFWSEECYRLLGLPPRDGSETLDTFFLYVHPRDRDAVRRAVLMAIEKNEHVSFDFSMLRADGEERIIHEEGEVQRDSRGRPISLIGTVQDVTEQRRAEKERAELVAALTAERRWLAAVVEGSPVGILLCEGTETPRIRCNQRAVELFGVPVGEEGGLELLRDRIFAPDGTRMAQGDLALERALRGETILGRERLIRRPDGKEIPVLVNASPIQNGEGLILGAVFIVHDIGPLKDLERQREEWTALVAHDLRQPLSAIIVSLEALARRMEPASARNRAVRAVTSARRLDRMIDDLLEVSRLEAHRLELALSPTDLVALVQASVDPFAHEGDHQKVIVTAKDDVPRVQADAHGIQRVVENLLSNARKYGMPGAVVEVTVERVDAEVRVGIRNRGPGIPPEDLPVIFERFERGRAQGGKVRGQGLGLYIAKALVQAHGGRIWVDSVPGETTTFWFTLPIDAGAP